jgi:hypothetical protein
MRKKIAFFCLGFCILFSACTFPISRNQTIDELYTSTITVSVQPTVNVPTQSDLCQPIIISPSADKVPVFVFLQDEELYVQVDGNSSTKIGNYFDLGSIKEARIIDGILYLLQENGIQQIYLDSCVKKVLLRFNRPISSGMLMPESRDPRVFYNGITADLGNTLIGYYDPSNNSVNTVLNYQDPLVTLRLVGTSEDGQGLYCYPVGQDSDIGKILLLNISQGEVSKELPIQGWSYIALAPNLRLLATFARIPDSSGQMENSINLYDLPSLPLTSPRIISFQNSSDGVGYGGLHWSSDSSKIYFIMIDNVDDPSASTHADLVYLDVKTGVIHKAVPVSDPTIHLGGISPDGKRVLLRQETNDEAILIDTADQEMHSFTVPLDAILVDWR